MLETTQTRISKGVIDLGVGHPSLSLLPLELLRQAAQHRLSQGDSTFLQYGAEPGDGRFRTELARFLTRHYRFPAEPEGLFITAGASQALDLICAAFTQPGQVIFVEEPTYFLSLGIFRDHHLEVVAIPTDEQGLDVEALEAALQRHRPTLVYTIPTFQNPTGVSLGQERRARLVELSQEYGFLIVADEVYQLLHYYWDPPPPLGSFAAANTVLSLGSFSKILAPGLRLGWIQAAPPLLQRLIQNGLVASGGGLNPFTSAIVRSALELGLQDQHLQRLRHTYRERLGAMLEALNRAGLRPRYAPEGGYFVWLELDPSLDAQALLKQAIRAGVRYQPGVRFSSQGHFAHALRLCFAYYDPAELTEGIQRLAAVLGVR
ncbi:MULTISPECIES: PLP-dependent aminotransferase family protein [unclassified Meiothermus]|uniref:aminotransferase-like domain-containing protein n=1 Tax=unclassified Meiothermus TaxID=370471 RepID=UPI000D7BE009|nr:MULTISPECIES: PLP-dependent aminotransferase family protein [unclassified Meiothermus]PZA08532.1 PLP-dependent aminotransferase family protein [Meiothermus sp. Pnk-1]RYM36863.1 PLP-dependent aminotransferase family protein [Meiothermus sp. PNK-Is4]